MSGGLITAKSFSVKTIFNLIYKYVIYIIQFLIALPHQAAFSDV